MTPERGGSCVTAQSFSGDRAVVAYSARRPRLGPNGEPQVAFLLRTNDRGGTWQQIPLTRSVWSFFRYPGFPVWPPEFVTDVVGPESPTIAFRDEYVMFEPGGESQWTATLSRRGIWTIRRVRRMDYEGSDEPNAPAPVPLQLPAGFKEPDRAFVGRAAATAVTYDPLEVPLWLWLIPALALGIQLGAGDIVGAVVVLGGMIFGLSAIWTLLDRQRQRQAAAGHVVQPCLYARLLGPSWQQLAEPVRRLHDTEATVHARGRLQITHGGTRAARVLVRLLRLPRANAAVPTELAIVPLGDREAWWRTFHGQRLDSLQFDAGGRAVGERFGRLEFRFRPEVHDGSLVMRQLAAAFRIGAIRLRLPSAWMPKVDAREDPAAGAHQIHVHVSIEVPALGPVLTYDGTMDVEDALA